MSLSKNLIIPSMQKEEGDSPGCTLAEIKTLGRLMVKGLWLLGNIPSTKGCLSSLQF